LRGHHQEVLRGTTRATCAERCIEHRRFACRSASYDTQREECRLSGEDRHSQPQAFQANPNYEYIENQCTPGNRRPRGFAQSTAEQKLPVSRKKIRPKSGRQRRSELIFGFAFCPTLSVDFGLFSASGFCFVLNRRG
jgi:PAN domain